MRVWVLMELIQVDDEHGGNCGRCSRRGRPISSGGLELGELNESPETDLTLISTPRTLIFVGHIVERVLAPVKMPLYRWDKPRVDNSLMLVYRADAWARRDNYPIGRGVVVQWSLLVANVPVE